MVTGRPSRPLTMLGEHSYCSSSLGHVLAVHEQELGAQQADAHRAGGARGLELARQLDIGLERDLDAVARDRGQLGEARELALGADLLHAACAR